VSTRDHAYRMLAWRLRQAGVPGAELDARLLVQAAAGASEIEMIREPGRLMSQEQLARLAKYEQRRLDREPVSKILGRREFWGLEFLVDHSTLDPRPDSETLVEVSLRYLRDVPTPRLLDLGTGSGCLLLALLSAKEGATGRGIDISSDAICMANRNAERLGFQTRASFHAGDWADIETAPYDLIVSNPPYIARAEIDSLEDEVRLFDPRQALDGGPDGLEVYRSLASLIPRLLAPQGHAVIELGFGQAASVSAVFAALGLETIEVAEDLARVSRALVLRQKV